MVDERFAALLGELGRAPEDVRGDRHRRARARSPSQAASRSSRRSCRAGTASRSRAGSPAATTRRCSSTTTSTSWPWASTGRTGARPSTCCSSRSAPASAAGSSPGARSTAAPQGAAGDIGHIRLAGHEDVVCRCGNLGCLEAVAGGGALARRLTAAGIEAHDSRDVVRLVRADDAARCGMVREAGRYLGEVLGELRQLLQPGGDRHRRRRRRGARQLLAGVREVTIQRSLPLATARAARSWRAGWATARAWSARRSWSSSTCSRPTWSTGWCTRHEPAPGHAVHRPVGRPADRRSWPPSARSGASTGSSSRAGATTSTSPRRSPTRATPSGIASGSPATGSAAGRSATTSSARRSPTRSTRATRPCSRPRCGATATPRACRSAPPSG